MADLLTLASQLRANLERQSDAEFKRLSSDYQAVADALEGDIDALSRDLVTGDSPESLASFKRFDKNLTKQLDGFTSTLIRELTLVAGLWLSMGVSDSNMLMQQAADDAGQNVDLVPFDALLLDALNRYLAPGSPLLKRLEEYGAANAQRIKDMIINNVWLGKSPRDVARLIVSEGLGMGLTDALRMARTLQLYAHREATLANYRQNKIIKGWIWSSALIPGRTCISCVNMHGTIHGLDEILNDHHNGLCAMLPYLGGRNPIKQNGETWFNNLPKAQQQKMMGVTKWEAWQAGKFNLTDVTGTHVDPVYGEMRIERSLKDLLGE